VRRILTPPSRLGTAPAASQRKRGTARSHIRPTSAVVTNFAHGRRRFVNKAEQTVTAAGGNDPSRTRLPPLTRLIFRLFSELALASAISRCRTPQSSGGDRRGEGEGFGVFKEKKRWRTAVKHALGSATRQARDGADHLQNARKPFCKRQLMRWPSSCSAPTRAWRLLRAAGPTG